MHLFVWHSPMLKSDVRFIPWTCLLVGIYHTCGMFSTPSVRILPVRVDNNIVVGLCVLFRWSTIIPFIIFVSGSARTIRNLVRFHSLWRVSMCCGMRLVKNQFLPMSGVRSRLHHGCFQIRAQNWKWWNVIGTMLVLNTTVVCGCLMVYI